MMNTTRREMLVGVSALSLTAAAHAQTALLGGAAVSNVLRGFTTLPIGGGGSIFMGGPPADDGSMAFYTDTFGAYVKRNDNDGLGEGWKQTLTIGTYGDNQPASPGIYAIALAPSSSDVGYQVAPSKAGDVKSERWYLYKTTDKFRTMTKLTGWSTTRNYTQNPWNLVEAGWKRVGPRLAIDPFNSDHCIVCCSPGSISDAGVWRYLNGTFSKLVDYGTDVKIFAGYVVRFDRSGGTTTVSGQTVCKNVFIGVAGHGGLWSTDGGQNFIRVSQDPTPSSGPHSIAVADNSVICVFVITPGTNRPKKPAATGLTFQQYGGEVLNSPYFNGTVWFYYAKVTTGGIYNVTVPFVDGCIDTFNSNKNIVLVCGVSGGINLTSESTIFDGISTKGQITAASVKTSANNTLALMMAHTQFKNWSAVAAGTTFVVGTKWFDSADNSVWKCLVQHTKPGSGTFADFRAANLTYWTAHNNSTGFTHINGTVASQSRLEFRSLVGGTSGTVVGTDDGNNIGTIIVLIKGDGTIGLSGTPVYATSNPANGDAPVSIVDIQFDYAGTAYVVDETGRSQGHLWRWVPKNGPNTFEEITRSGVGKLPPLMSIQSGGIAVDPRAGYEGRVFYTANGRPNNGYAPSVRIGAGVNLSTVGWHGGMTAVGKFTLRADAKWMETFTVLGFYNNAHIDPTNGDLWVFTGMGPCIVTVPIETTYSNVTVTMQVKGTEQLVASDVCRPPGSAYPIAIAEDFLVLPCPTPNFPTVHFPDGNSQGIGTQLDFAWGTPYIFAAIASGQTAPRCSWSNNYGVAGSWTQLSVNPANDSTGGPCCAVGSYDAGTGSANAVLVPGYGVTTPRYTTNNWATWADCAIIGGGDLSATYTTNLQSRSRMVAANRNFPGHYLLIKPDGSNPGIFRSVDGGAGFSRVNTFTFARGAVGAIIEHIPGRGAGKTYILGPQQGGARKIYITEDEGVNITELTFGLTAYLFCCTQKLPGATDATLCMMGQVPLAACHTDSISHAREFGFWISSDLYGAFGKKWKWIGGKVNMPTVSQLDSAQTMRGDWEADGAAFYVAMNGSGFVHFRGI